MPLAGGPADKVGNRYELKWVVNQFIRLLEGELNRLTVEHIGSEGDRIEFLTQSKEGHEEGHQVKRQQAGKGYWTIADLSREHVLEGMQKHALSGKRTFVFVTSEGVKGLRELTERARDSESFIAFEQHFLSKDLSGEFTKYTSYCNTESENAWLVLRSSKFRSIDEKTLTEIIDSRLGKLVDGIPQAAYSILAMYALEQIHQPVTAGDLWNVLAANNIRSNQFALDANLVLRLEESFNEYKTSQAFDIAGQNLKRRETKDVISAFCNDPLNQVVFLTGKAGAGKTGVAAQVSQHFVSDGWLVLAFRMDRLDPTHRVAQVGQQILGREKSPVAILAGIANGNDCMLVIEQLDAVSTVSSRNPEFFECVASMVKEALVHPNMRVLLVCRAFDLENDQRFRELSASLKERMLSVSVNVFELDEVKAVLLHLGIDSNELSKQQLDLLRLPLHLRLFSIVVAESGLRSMSFMTGNDLFDEFWRHANTTVSPRLSDPNLFARILETLCKEMNRSKSLSVPAGAIRLWASDVDRLTSANILLRQAGRIAFFHEGFFDYVFARFFIESGKRLFDYLHKREQDLFLRAQVRQVLAYLRDQKPDVYLQEVSEILNSADIRFHIKKLALSVVCQAGDPTTEEWKLLEHRMSSNELGIALAAQSAILPSCEWFLFLSENGTLNEWITGEKENLRNFAMAYVQRMMSDAPETVAQLVGKIAGKDPKTDKQLVSLIAFTHKSALHPDLEALAYQIIDNPERNWEFYIECYEQFIDKIAYQDARAGCRALGHFLNRLLDLPQTEHPFVAGRRKLNIADHDITRLADDAPVDFADMVFAPLIATMEMFAVREGNPPYKEEVWYSELSARDHFGINNLFWNFVQSLMKTAQVSPECYYKAIDRLMESEIRWAHLILLRVLNIDYMAEKAISYLMGHWRRSGIWYDDFGVWAARCLLQTASGYVPANMLNELELLILEQWEEWDPEHCWNEDIKRCARWYRQALGRRQYTLLSALPMDQLSTVSKTRLAELSRKAKVVGWKLERPLSSGGGLTESPLSSDVTTKMSDLQWLTAIQKYATVEDREWLEDKIIGGARELSRMLETCTNEQPIRFAELMLRFPKNANSHYFDAVVMGLCKGGLPVGLLSSVVNTAKELCSEEGGRRIVDMIAAHCEEPLPDELINVVEEFALNASDPQQELWRKDAGSGAPYYSGGPYSHGINTVRGHAAEAIARMIATDRRYWEATLHTLERMVCDPSIAIRSCVANACTQGLRYDRTNAVRLFLILCETEDVLLNAQTIENFLHYTCISEFEHVRPIIERMIVSQETLAREAGARQGCIATLELDEAYPLLQVALRGDETVRKAAAQVFAANLGSAHHRDACIANLIPLFDDPSKEVRAKAGEWCLRRNIGNKWEHVFPVPESYIESAAFLDDPDNFFMALEEVTDVSAHLIFRAVERFVEGAGEEARDLRRRPALTSKRVTELILRSYYQAQDDNALRVQCLDAFDRLLAVEAYGTLEALDSLER